MDEPADLAVCECVDAAINIAANDCQSASGCLQKDNAEALLA